MTIKENLEELDRKIGEAAAKSGRRRQDITLVAVSKTVGAAEVAEAYRWGQRGVRGEPRTMPGPTSLPGWNHLRVRELTGI